MTKATHIVTHVTLVLWSMREGKRHHWNEAGRLLAAVQQMDRWAVSTTSRRRSQNIS